MATLLLAGFSVGTGIIATWAAVIQVTEYRASRRIVSLEEFPIPIKRSISYGDYLKVLGRLQNYLDQRRMKHDIVVAVHYGGLGPASDIARIYYCPVRHVEVELQHENGEPVCSSVIPRFPLEELQGKKVLVVDNSIRSGRTLKIITETLASHAAEVRTCVLYKKTRAAGSFHRPDIIIFESDQPLKQLLK